MTSFSGRLRQSVDFGNDIQDEWEAFHDESREAYEPCFTDSEMKAARKELLREIYENEEDLY